MRRTLLVRFQRLKRRSNVTASIFIFKHDSGTFLGACLNLNTLFAVLVQFFIIDITRRTYFVAVYLANTPGTVWLLVSFRWKRQSYDSPYRLASKNINQTFFSFFNISRHISHTLLYAFQPLKYQFYFASWFLNIITSFTDHSELFKH